MTDRQGCAVAQRLEPVCFGRRTAWSKSLRDVRTVYQSPGLECKLEELPYAVFAV